jgi:hypothetical protein
MKERPVSVMRLTDVIDTPTKARKKFRAFVFLCKKKSKSLIFTAL